MSERLKRLEQEYHDWVEMHTGIIPSEDLVEFELDASDRWWLLQQAKRTEELEDINQKQNKAIKDIHSIVFLNLNIPEQERNQILDKIAQVIRL